MKFLKVLALGLVFCIFATVTSLAVSAATPSPQPRFAHIVSIGSYYSVNGDTLNFDIAVSSDKSVTSTKVEASVVVGGKEKNWSKTYTDSSFDAIGSFAGLAKGTYTFEYTVTANYSGGSESASGGYSFTIK